VGQYGTFQRDKTPQALIETLVMEMIGAGAEAILYFRHKSPRFEQPHKFTGAQGVFRRDGSPLPHLRTPQRVAEVMERLGERILTARTVAPQVGVYYPEESCLFSLDAGYRGLQSDACYGASSLWGRLGYPVHILPTRELLEEDLSALKLIYLPASWLLPAAAGERLRRYVHEGGTLLSEVRPGYVGDDGWLYEEQPGAGLAEVFGAREDLFWNASELRVCVRFDGCEHTAAYPAAFQSYRLFGGQAIAHSAEGEILGVAHDFGRGRAILLGFAPSLLFPLGGGKYERAAASSGTPADQAAALALIADLASRAGARPPVAFDFPHRRIALRHKVSPCEQLLFVMNYGPATPIALPAGFSPIACGGAAELSFCSDIPNPFPTHGWLIASSER